MGKQSYDAGIHISMILQLGESLQCILHLLEQDKKIPMLSNRESESIFWEERTQMAFLVTKKNPLPLKLTWKRHVLLKRKGKIFFFYAIFSPKSNTVKQESLRPTEETKWYFAEWYFPSDILHWHWNLAGMLEQLNRYILWDFRHSDTSGQFKIYTGKLQKLTTWQMQISSINVAKALFLSKTLFNRSCITWIHRDLKGLRSNDAGEDSNCIPRESGLIKLAMEHNQFS